ncbi:hypothetical protein EGM70_13950 [Enterobacteriaceae bacterium 89]|nr:hypothetical protein [Enterobacteriaceae bacterium 89]
MAVIKSSSEQQVEHLLWLRLESAARQYGFVMLILLLMAGFYGLFSKDIFSNAYRLSTDHSLRVDYQRFGRSQSEMDLKLSMRVPQSDGYTLTFGGQFMDKFEINEIYPQPWKFSFNHGVLTLEFHDLPQVETQTLWLSLQPRDAGKVSSTLRVNHQAPVAITQYIYP